MNKRERREKYLSTRRTPEYLEKRAKWQADNKKWVEVCKRYDFDNKTVDERYDIMVAEGLLDPTAYPRPTKVEL